MKNNLIVGFNINLRINNGYQNTKNDKYLHVLIFY